MTRKITRKNIRANKTKSFSLKGIIKISLTVILINIAYLIILPLITAQFVPCLGQHPFASYESKKCTVEGALDQFMKLAVIGMSVLTIVFLSILKRYLRIAPFHDMKTWTKIPSRKQFMLEFVPLALTTLFMAASIVVFYLIFIPTAENAVRNAPIILDTISHMEL